MPPSATPTASTTATATATTATASRTVARPVANLGNTCYMNCVLQALAHAPELCLAIDCEPHRRRCPYAKKKLLNKTRSSSPPASSDEDDPPFVPPDEQDYLEDEEQEPSKVATRKSRRRSPNSQTSSDNDNCSGAGDEFCTLCEFEEHIRKVHIQNRKDKAVVPSSFVNGFIEHVAPWFRLGVQEDSHEFLRLLIDAMQNSCLRARSPAAEGEEMVEEHEESKNRDTTTASNSSSSQREENDKEYPFSLFRGTVESKVICDSCKASSSTHDPIEDIGLDVTLPAAGMEQSSHRSATAASSSSRANSPIPPALADVQSALQRFARAEALDAGYKCEKCGKLGKATKQSRLASIPPILTLQLKRFRYGERVGTAAANQRPRRSEVSQLNDSYFYSSGKSGSAKIEGPVKFDTIFDLKPYLTPKLQEEHASMFCRLFAVIVHAGKNSHSGHYIAYVRNVSKNEWWKMDDGRVTPVSEREVKQAEAYMLFYRVVQHPLTLRLEELHRKQQLLLQKSAAENEPVMLTSAVVKKNIKDTDSSFLKKNRKRQATELCDGLEWARIKTSTPPHLLGVFRKAQEFIADDVQLSSDFFQSLSAQAARNAKSAPPSISGKSRTTAVSATADSSSSSSSSSSWDTVLQHCNIHSILSPLLVYLYDNINNRG